MSNSPLGIKPQFSGHETFPLRQLWLRKAYKAVKDLESKTQKETKAPKDTKTQKETKAPKETKTKAKK